MMDDGSSAEETFLAIGQINKQAGKGVLGRDGSAPKLVFYHVKQ